MVVNHAPSAIFLSEHVGAGKLALADDFDPAGNADATYQRKTPRNEHDLAGMPVPEYLPP